MAYFQSNLPACVTCSTVQHLYCPEETQGSPFEVALQPAQQVVAELFPDSSRRWMELSVC